MGGEIIIAGSSGGVGLGGGEIIRKPPSKLYVGRSRRQAYDIPSRQRAIRPAATKHSSSSWWNAPETKRRKRVAQYKFYAIEGKVKISIKKGFRWFKKTCSRIAHGF